jgi:hypothetical protein
MFKWFLFGFMAGCASFHFGQDLTLSYVISELQYGLSLLQQNVMEEI